MQRPDGDGWLLLGKLALALMCLCLFMAFLKMDWLAIYAAASFASLATLFLAVGSILRGLWFIPGRDLSAEPTTDGEKPPA